MNFWARKARQKEEKPSKKEMLELPFFDVAYLDSVKILAADFHKIPLSNMLLEVI